MHFKVSVQPTKKSCDLVTDNVTGYEINGHDQHDYGKFDKNIHTYSLRGENMFWQFKITKMKRRCSKQNLAYDFNKT